MRGCIIRCFPLRTSAVSGFSFSVSKDFPSSISLHAHRGARTADFGCYVPCAPIQKRHRKLIYIGNAKAA
jgi:hypothetical protein